LLGLDLPHGHLGSAVELVLHACPPNGRAAGVAVNGDDARAGTGFHHAAFVGLAQFDPVHHFAGEIALPQIGGVGVRQARGHLQHAQVVVARHIQGKGEHTQGQALVVFRRVAGDGELMVCIQAAVHVGDLQMRFVDGCLQGHDKVLKRRVTRCVTKLSILPCRHGTMSV